MTRPRCRPRRGSLPRPHRTGNGARGSGDRGDPAARLRPNRPLRTHGAESIVRA